MPAVPGEPSLQSSKGQAAATAEQHSGLDHDQEAPSDVAEPSALKSSAGMSAAGTTGTAGLAHDEQTAHDSGLEVPRLESAVGKQVAAEESAAGICS